MSGRGPLPGGEVNGPAVTIVIVTWNGLAMTRRALESIRAQRSGERLEILVVDNGSTDGTVETLRSEFPEVTTLALGSNLGFARANNAALALITAPLVFLLNNDTVLADGALRALLSTAVAAPEFSILAPEMVQMQAPGLVDNRGIYLDVTGRCRQLDTNRLVSDQRASCEIFGASGGACLIRREVVQTIGLFDESLESYWEDCDFALRARAAGHRCLFVPAARIYHEGSATGKRIPERRLYLIQRNTAIVSARWLPFRVRRAESWLSLARQAYDVSRSAFAGHAGVVLRAKRDAFGTPAAVADRVAEARIRAWVGRKSRPVRIAAAQCSPAGVAS